MQMIIETIAFSLCPFVPVIGYALYRSYRLVQLQKFLEISAPSGQSNTALIKLMQGIEQEIESRSTYRTIPDYGYTTQEVADGLRLMVSAKPSMRDYQPEQCSFTQYNDDGFAFPMSGEEQK